MCGVGYKTKQNDTKHIWQIKTPISKKLIINLVSTLAKKMASRKAYGSAEKKALEEKEYQELQYLSISQTQENKGRCR